MDKKIWAVRDKIPNWKMDEKIVVEKMFCPKWLNIIFIEKIEVVYDYIENRKIGGENQSQWKNWS